MHRLVDRVKGKPRKCEYCGILYKMPTQNGKRAKIEWANKHRKLTFNVNDYIALCTKCHFEYDTKICVI